MTLLTVDNLHVVYGHVRATQGLSFSLNDGEIIAAIGSNGAGKSSTLKAIMGMAKIQLGSIMLWDKSITGLMPHEIVRKGVGFSPEGRRVFPGVSVLDNLMAGGHVLPRPAINARLEQILTYFPRLRERRKQLAGSLSGGEQQMLAIGRALMSRPHLLLLDEPTLGLAPVITQHIGEVIRDIQKAENLAVVLAEQNAVWALKVANRGVVLERGRIKISDDSSALSQSSFVRKAYLGI